MRTTTTDAGDGVGFGALIDKVKQAEATLESRERVTTDAWAHFRATWRAAWTPWRIVGVGVVAGFIVGKAEPLRKTATGSGALQLLSALAGLFAGGSAQAAASEAEHAAGEAEHAAETAEQTAEQAAAATAAADVPPPGFPGA
jgi:hypothetical protein